MDGVIFKVVGFMEGIIFGVRFIVVVVDECEVVNVVSGEFIFKLSYKGEDV